MDLNSKTDVLKGKSDLRFLGNIGVGGERGDVWNPDGICPSESATQYKDAIKILINENEDRRDNSIRRFVGRQRT